MKKKRYVKYGDKKIIGAIEPVEIDGKIFLARIDTGATRSSVCKSLLKKLNLGPPVKKVQIESSSGISMRPVIKTKIVLAGKKMTSTFTVAPRKHLQYEVLIGRNVLRRGFIVDVKR